MPERPNVLLIVLDAARRDCLEPYGAEPGSTPAIAQLASSGVALPDVHATCCWTAPSHASMFTGLLPRAAGLARVPSPAAARPVLSAHRERLLPEVMRRAGYSTNAASANLWLSRASGFDTGFDVFEQVDTDRNGRIHVDSRRERARWLAEAARAKVDDGAARVESMLGRSFADSAERPFFWFVNLLECHSPYLPPRPYGRTSVLERLRAAEDARRYYTLAGIWRACAGISPVPEETLARMRHLYRESLRYMDDWLARVLDHLDAARRLDDTLVVILSDHGENFGEGGLLAHALSLDQRLIHVPLVMSGPGAHAGEIASLAELPRLLAQAVGLEDHPWHDGPPQGVGIAQLDPPLIDDSGAQAEKARRAGLGGAIELLSTPQACATADGLKVLRRGDREEVFDLEKDPLESNPVAAEALDAHRQHHVRRLREALDHPSVVARRPVEPHGDAGGAPSDELRDLEERMKLLGYM